MFRKILVANRGEIAVRVIRACRDLGIPSVAIFSEVDKTALHVQMADESVCVGEAAPLSSYLNFESILEAAKKTGSDAIHPGYGFLSENHRFAAACKDTGLTFIGPSPEAIELVGDKVTSRQTLEKVGVPIIPGMSSSEKSMKVFTEWAEKIGYPVMVKASAGGGGKGMRIVREPDTLEDAVASGRREAGSAFGDDTVYLEKCIERPRHVEFQVLADHHGNAVHLFERECSIQRRHQKIIEETPSTALDEDLRQRMGQSALDVVKATGYTNAGTVEFLVDTSGNYYFLEVNARVQVEHPITELVTGIDLVQWQIRIAAGDTITFKQKDLTQRGHAIECRIYAEDPSNNFLPALGRILYMRNPEGPSVRVDSGIYSGCDVTMHYDPILSKLIVWAEDRDSARNRMLNALKDYVILGIPTPIPFLIDVLSHNAFANGETMTDFIPKYFPDWKYEADVENLPLAACTAIFHEIEGKKRQNVVQTTEKRSIWNQMGPWRIGDNP